MRRFNYTLAAACISVGLFAGTSGAQSTPTPPMGTTATKGISGSSHDFGSASWNQSQQICLPCHIPHSATLKDSNGQLLGAPLWNHSLSKTATYTLFQSYVTTSTMTNGVTQASSAAATVQTGNVDQNSKLCLSCHDGTVAMDSFSSVPHGLAGTMKAGTGTTFIASWADKTKGTGNDLSSNHPIGDAARWTYPTPSYMVDPSLRDAKRIMPLRPMADGGLAVGCTSCHEPHNRNGNADFLWVNNSGPGTTVDGRSVSGSTLCMNCHIK